MNELRIHDRAAAGDELLAVEGLVKHFPITGGLLRRPVGSVRAVDGVTFDIKAGETVALVGESGCGKSTLGRTVLRLLEPDSGRIHFRGVDVTHWRGSQLRNLRREMQIVFQNPLASLNPRRSVEDIIAEPLRIHHRYEGPGQVGDLLGMVGLDANAGDRYPHEFSGGQQQRIGIARALALRPQLLILDEPVSALDVSIQAQVLNLLEELQGELELAYLFISHDLSVVRHVADRVAVMYLGKVVEQGPNDDLFGSPVHPYTQALLSAVPVSDPDDRRLQHRRVLEGDVPNPADPPSGCRFRTRCWKAAPICTTTEPLLESKGAPGHKGACHFAEKADVLGVDPLEEPL